MNEHTLVVFIAELILLLLVGRLLGEAMNRLGQPSIFGQLLAGVLLGPSVFGALAPGWQKAVFPGTPESKSMLDAVSQIGILLLLLLTGMEANLRLLNRRMSAVIATSLCGIAVPFLCGFGIAFLLPGDAAAQTSRVVTALFLGTALSISSVKIVAMVLMEVDAIRRDIGQLILATAILDDTVAWVIIAVIAGIASKSTVDVQQIGMTLAVTGIFLAISLTAGRRFVAYAIRWTNDNLTVEVPVITTILVIMLAMALTTEAIGVHTALGAFVAGLLIGQSPILTEHIEGELRGLIVAFFSPVFFALAGLGMDVRTLFEPSLLLMTLAVIAVASVGKFGGAMLGGRLGGLSGPESFALATGLNARGSTEVIIASIGLSMGAFSKELYTMVVAMAIVTTMMMPPTLRWALARVPIRQGEAKRLEKEEAEQHESLPRIERALVFADESPNGAMAAHLAGMFAVSRQVVTTVVGDAEGKTAGNRFAEAERAANDAIKRRLLDSEETDADPPLPIADLLQVKALDAALPAAEATLNLAAKGYGIIFVGLQGPLQGGADRFDEQVGLLAEKFDGPLAIALNGHLFTMREGAGTNILVPTGGKPEARLATELALALTKAADGQLTTLHVHDPSNDDARSYSGRWPGLSVLEEAKRLGERGGVIVKGISAVNSRAEVGILGAAQSGGYDLIVVGTALRQVPGNFLGSRSAMLLRTIRKPILLVTRPY